MDIDIAEESFEEAVRALYSEIDMLWCRYAQKSDDKLTDGAIELKKKIQALIKGVKCI
jgi:hypothetical protein